MLNGGFGYGVVARHVCRGLNEAGHTARILSTLNIGELIKDEFGTHNFPPYFMPFGKYALLQYIKGYDIDVVVTLLDCWEQAAHDIPDKIHMMKIRRYARGRSLQVFFVDLQDPRQGGFR